MVGRRCHGVFVGLRVRVWPVGQVCNLPDEMAGCKPAPLPLVLTLPRDDYTHFPAGGAALSLDAFFGPSNRLSSSLIFFSKF